MMLTRMNRKAKPVVREKRGEDAALWRIFDPEFKGKVEVIACADVEDGFNVIIRDNFRVPSEAALAVELPQGKAKGVPKRQVEKGVRFRQKKKHEPADVPPLVPRVAGISCTSFHRYIDYVVVSDTLEGLGIPGGGAAAGGSAAGSKPTDEKKKRKIEEKAAGTGERKRSRLRMTRTVSPCPIRSVRTGSGRFCLEDKALCPCATFLVLLPLLLSLDTSIPTWRHLRSSPNT
ncbi:hypothetical protein HanOQP8_Chr11g0392991 [Helianthus annuus]|nr:hypothetical protein HanOQP8_Chr11g0392991 [Helianthus annuus]